VKSTGEIVKISMEWGRKIMPTIRLISRVLKTKGYRVFLFEVFLCGGGAKKIL
jgi:hypothetical protein